MAIVTDYVNHSCRMVFYWKYYRSLKPIRLRYLFEFRCGRSGRYIECKMMKHDDGVSVTIVQFTNVKDRELATWVCKVVDGNIANEVGSNCKEISEWWWFDYGFFPRAHRNHIGRAPNIMLGADAFTNY